MLYKDKPCPHCGRYSNRGVTVNSIIIQNNKILLIERGVEPDKGFWALPGGYVNWDENTEDASLREALEETGLLLKIQMFVKVSSNPSRHPQQTINVSYLSTQFEGTIKHGDDANNIKWFELDNLPEKLAFDHMEIINKAKELLENKH